MYDNINDVTFYNVTDRDKFVYLMIKHISDKMNIQYLNVLYCEYQKQLENAWDYDILIAMFIPCP